MKLKSVIFLGSLLLFSQLSCAQVVSQKDMNAIRFPYENALTILQGGVQAGVLPAGLEGPEFVAQGLAGNAFLLKEFKDYYVTGTVKIVGTKKTAVLLLCDKKDGVALLEGVLCKKEPTIAERWKASSGHPCVFDLDVQAACR
jgi:hypothetical protein